MQIVKEKLEIDEELEKKINNLLKFSNIKAKLENGGIISLINTNIAYAKPHILKIIDIISELCDKSYMPLDIYNYEWEFLKEKSNKKNKIIAMHNLILIGIKKYAIVNMSSRLA